MLDFIVTNLPELLVALLGTQVLAQFIVNLTPTPADDAVVAKVYRGIEIAAGIWTRKAKDLPGETALRVAQDAAERAAQEAAEAAIQAAREFLDR